MARKPMVTRTFKTSQVTVLGLNLETTEPENKTITLSRTYDNEKKLMKVVSAELDNETFKTVKIVDTKIIEQLYGMSEQDFLANATPMPPRDEKVVKAIPVE